MKKKENQFNMIDRMISIVDPEKALKRIAARKTLEVLNSGYSEGGASRRKKSLKGWNANSRAPVEDIDENLKLLRQRSRDLYMNAPIAHSTITTIRTNVVGAGLQLKPIIDAKKLNITEEKAEKIKQKIETEFGLWAESKLCDSCRINNFYELQQLAQISWLMSGDCFALLKFEKATNIMPYSLRIHLIEADRICNKNGLIIDKNAENNNSIYNGIEVNKNGASTAVWICSKYPNSYYYNIQEELKWIRVPFFGEKTGRRNILQLMESERPEQRRGVPILASVIEPLKQLTRYTEAELMAAVISSMFTVFITTKDSDTSVNPLGEMIPQDQQNYNTYEEREYELGVGAINVLGEGESIEIADPKRPTNSFEAFINSLAKSIGAALEIPQELLLKSFTSSYSASRAALLEAWKMFKMRRNWLSSDFCQPIYEEWLTEAVASGRIEAPGFFKDETIRKIWCKAEWYGPTQGQLDPVKEVNAAKERVNNGFSTRQKETMELTGTDFYNNVKQLKKEKELLGG